MGNQKLKTDFCIARYLTRMNICKVSFQNLVRVITMKIKVDYVNHFCSLKQCLCKENNLWPPRWLNYWLLACVDNPVSLTQYHSGRFTGKGWSCCKAATFRSSPGCKPSTIYGMQWFFFSRNFSCVVPRTLERTSLARVQPTYITPLHDLLSRSQAMMTRTNHESCYLSEIGKNTCTQHRNKTKTAASSSSASSI